MKKAKNGEPGVEQWFRGRRLQFLLIAVGVGFVAYKIGRHLERKKIQARLAKLKAMPNNRTLQQKMGVSQTAPTPKRDSMGFTDVNSDLSGMGCGNKPCASCVEQQCEYPAVAQADVPSEEFEFQN
jgi:hypothetical protein